MKETEGFRITCPNFVVLWVGIVLTKEKKNEKYYDNNKMEDYSNN